MLAARRLGENGVMIPIEPSAVFAAWQSFQARNFGPLHLDPPRLEHRREAIACEASEEWFAAVWHLDQTLRADPGNADLLARRGVAHLKLEDWEKAIDDLRLATAQQPAYAARLGQALFSNGDFAGAEVEFKKALARNETDPVVREQLSKTYLELGQLEAAERELVMLTGPASDNPSPWQRLAVVRLELGYKNGGGPAQLESYRQTCRDMIKQFEERDEAGAIVAWPCMLAPDCGVDPARLVAIAQGAVQKDPTNFYRLNTLGAAHCRAGQWEEAVKVLTHSRRAFQEHQLAIGLPATAEDGRAPDWVFLAMAQHALEKSGKAPAGAAQRALEKAEKAIDKLGKSTTGSPLEISRKSWNKVELHRLLSEVRQLFEQPAPPAAAR